MRLGSFDSLARLQTLYEKTISVSCGITRHIHCFTRIARRLMWLVTYAEYFLEQTDLADCGDLEAAGP